MPKKRTAAATQLGLEGEGVDLLREAEAARASSQLRQVDPRRIRKNRDQPRTEFDPASLEELAASISEHGVLQPLLVREVEDGALELLAGERRQRAAILAGLERVPVRVLHVRDGAATAIALAENLAREDLSPWEEAVALARFRDTLAEAGQRRTRDELARMVGRSGGAVSESLLIADRITPILSKSEIDRQTLTKVPKTALVGVAQGRDDKQRIALLQLALARVSDGRPAGTAVASAKKKRGRAARDWMVMDRLRDRGTLSFSLRRKPEELAPEEARDALARLTPVVEALRRRAGSDPPPPV